MRVSAVGDEAAAAAPRIDPFQAQMILRRTIPARLPMLLIGAPGVGKTALVEQLAKELTYDFFISHPVTSEPTDYRGLPWIVDGRACFLPIGDLERLSSLGDRPAIWLIDDLGTAPPATQAAVMQLVHSDSRSLNGFKLPESVSIIAATNRAQDRAGVGAFLAPLVSRFTTVLTIQPDARTFVPWAISKGNFNPLVAAFLKWRPDYLLDESRPKHNLEQRCSPRSWHHVSQLLDLGLSPCDLRPAVLGAITPAIGIEFLAFLDVCTNLPNADDIRADPHNSALPDDLGARYATTVHLAMSATPKDFDSLTKYMLRFPDEFQLLYMLTAIARTPELQETRTYTTWSCQPQTVALLQ
jgi:MoxR-like ATPase